MYMYTYNYIHVHCMLSVHTPHTPGRDVRVPLAPMGTADIGSAHSQEALPINDQGYPSHNDHTSYNDPHGGYGKSSHRRGSFGSEGPPFQVTSTSEH